MRGGGDAGPAFGQGGEEGGGRLVTRAHAVPEGQRALPAAGEAAYVAPEPVGLLAEGGAPLHQHRARFGRFDGVGGAVEELHAQVLLQFAYLPAERGLGDVEPLGGTGEVAFLGHGQEVAQAPKF